MLEQNFIGIRIHELRKKMNMSIQKFSALVNSSAGYISDIENGRSMPSIQMLISLCKALNISLSEFFSQGGTVEPLTPELKKLLDSARNMPPDQLKIVTDLIDALNKSRT